MASWESAGRISKYNYVWTSSFLLALGLVCSLARFYIRIYIHKEVGWDDAFLLLAICSMIVSFTLILLVVDTMYITESLLFDGSSISLPADIVGSLLYYRKISAIALVLMWATLCFVKLSFLAMFRKLIDRIPLMIHYWRFVVAYTIIVWGYGSSIYIVSCPDFNSIDSVQCVVGSGLHRALGYSISQITLDIVGDLLILFIPVRLIWKIRIRLSQKIALSCCLCLTVVMVVFGLLKGIGLKYEQKLDSVWETYWMTSGSQIGVILTAATAFRTFFVARMKERNEQRRPANYAWYTKTRNALKQVISRFFSKSNTTTANDTDSSRFNDWLKGDFPRGTITGIRTFLNEKGKTQAEGTEMLHSTATTEETEELFPFPDRVLSRPISHHQREDSNSSKDQPPTTPKAIWSQV